MAITKEQSLRLMVLTDEVVQAATAHASTDDRLRRKKAELDDFMEQLAEAPEPPARKRRSDIGVSRSHAEGCTCPKCDPAPNAAQPSLSGLPDEAGVEK